ncbi:hypothetical protein Poli38472_006130 [Pythium oligandrum]|uniref:Uncharacterized protein n=1 Tax=Pythium oligandrum TaxID=41045 RepID=A0A8K1CRT2_PYTOL|nr:hypothetical protein Poli38472_006130 [Pythium oligandrum]|eukprot:TMW68662.1 hypothetical protein Poli38472_006130 [Pythium oligandrum]
MLLKKDELSSGNGGKTVSAATALCSIADIYTRHDLDGKWRELAKVYEQRKNDDNFREILDLSAPSKRLNDLNGWHLERMAVGELGGDIGVGKADVAMIKQEARRTKQVLRKILANGKKFQAKRDEVTNTMEKQRNALLAELDSAKDFLGQIHSAEKTATEVTELTTPAPVEQRLLATVQPPEASANVDLSSAPSI